MDDILIMYKKLLVVELGFFKAVSNTDLFFITCIKYHPVYEAVSKCS